MEYVSLYRKWRPGNFKEVKGQEPIVQTLTHALEQGRIAHAYLFAGPRGTGKTSTAKILAKCLNCAEGVTPDPCGECPSCKKIKSGYAIDVMEIDAASNRGIDEIRDLREKVKFLPSEGRYKVYIIDEVHMLTTEAFNALLKTLEEPPAHVVFILATTELHKIPATILSRCQCFDFKPISLKEIASTLADTAAKEGVEISATALNLLARNAQGGLRDALGLLDQVVAFCGEKISEQDVTAILGLADQESLYQLAELIKEKNTAGLMNLVKSLVEEGRDLQQFVKGALGYFRNLLLYKVSPDPQEILELAPEEIERLGMQVVKYRRNQLMQIIETLSACENEMKWSFQARWTLEVALVKLVDNEENLELAQLKERISNLEALWQQGPPPVKKTVVEQSEKIIPAKEEVLLKEEFSAPPTASSLTLEEIAEVWPVVLEKLKKKKRTFHAYLLEGQLEALEGRQIILSFQKKFVFHKENAEKPEVKNLVEEILQQVLHQPVTLKCVLVDGQEKKNIEKKLPLESTPSHDEVADDPLIKKALELFGGEIIEIKEEKG